ncbi:MAG: DUF2950 family protein [Phycisphaerales bacterium]
MKRQIWPCVLGPCLLTIAALWAGCSEQEHAAAPAAVQETYASPEDAVFRLIDTARKGEFDLIVPILGPRLQDLEAETKERTEGDLQRLAAAYDRQHALLKEDDGSVTLEVGDQGWTFPAPIVEVNGRWRFDTEAGAKEIRARRIDRNEEDTIGTCLDFVAAQRAFFAMSAARGESVPAYAPRFKSTPGKRDGLYWSDDIGPPRSPLGPMVADAQAAGDLKLVEQPQAYQGYRGRVLTRQGKGAPGGEKNYLDGAGLLTGGFAFLAWPDAYGDTGVMTFQVYSDGTVYQKDLGEATADAAKAIEAFDPTGWEKVEP